MNSNEPVGLRAADDATLDLAFALQRNPGAYALVIGAGVSTEAGMPSAWDVQVALLREVAAGLGVRTDDVVGWWRSREGSDPRYDDLIERLAPSGNERQALLRGFFEPTARERDAGEKAPSAAHRSIARLVVTGRVRIVVTLNFDHLIETALLDAGVVPTVVSTPAEFTALPPLHAQSALVVHLHGEYTNPSSLLNTGDELSEYDPRTHDLMARIAAEYGLVFVGWSGVWDRALRDIVATNPNRFYTSWWVNRSPLLKQAEDLRSLRGGLVIRDAAQAALGRIADATDALAFTNARHPRAAAVAVASAKRALEGGHRAIGLHDELVSEFERLAADPALAASAARPRAEQTAVVEEAVRVLVPLVATTAYWGTPTTDAWWRDEIPGIATGDGASTGAATVLLWAAGVATVAAKRLDLTHDLLTNLTIGIPGQGYVGAAEALAPDRDAVVPRRGSVAGRDPSSSSGGAHRHRRALLGRGVRPLLVPPDARASVRPDRRRRDRRAPLTGPAGVGGAPVGSLSGRARLERGGARAA